MKKAFKDTVGLVGEEQKITKVTIVAAIMDCIFALLCR